MCAWDAQSLEGSWRRGASLQPLPNARHGDLKSIKQAPPRRHPRGAILSQVAPLCLAYLVTQVGLLMGEPTFSAWHEQVLSGFSCYCSATFLWHCVRGAALAAGPLDPLYIILIIYNCVKNTCLVARRLSVQKNNAMDSIL